ncbi:hypothetical protein J6590_098085, partial [Homalodisca vitripennis]
DIYYLLGTSTMERSGEDSRTINPLVAIPADLQRPAILRTCTVLRYYSPHYLSLLCFQVNNH